MNVTTIEAKRQQAADCRKAAANPTTLPGEAARLLAIAAICDATADRLQYGF